MLEPARSPGRADLRVGMLPLPDFTMLAFAGFLDTLRLAADEGDRSRPMRCAWTVMSQDRRPVRASNGVVVQPSDGLLDPARFDYLAVVGGTLHAGPRETPELVRYLRRAAEARRPLVGLCTGAFTLARAGLMSRRTACVSWFHHEDYAAEFPDSPVVSDRLFLDDGDRITCAGGVSVLHLASHLVDRHCGAGAAEKGLRIMIEEGRRGGASPQPAPVRDALPLASDARVRRALLFMERRLDAPLRLADLAEAAGSTPRTLARLFAQELGVSPAAALERLRLERARRMVERGARLADVSAECGFADSAHLARRYRLRFGETPGQTRRRTADAERPLA